MLAREVADECKDHTKSLSSLKESSQIGYLFSRTEPFEKKSRSNFRFCTVRFVRPQTVMCSLNSEGSKERVVNAIAILVSALIRLQN